MADVEIVVRNIVEGEEKIADLDTVFGKLNETVADSSSEQIKLQKAHADLLARVRATGKGFEDLTAAEIAATKGAKDFAKDTSKATKTATGFTGKLGQLTKGLVGLATAYAIGRAVTGFIKDSIAAARAAGVATDEFNELEAATSRLKREFGENIIGEGGGLTFLADMANSIADSFEAANLSARQLALIGLAKVTPGARPTQLEDVEGVTVGTIFDVATGEIIESTEALKLWNEQLTEVNNTTQSLEDRRLFSPHGTGFGTMSLAEQKEFVHFLNQVEEEAGGAAEEVEGFFESINRGIDQVIAGRILDIDFQLAGGLEFQELEAQITAAIEAGLDPIVGRDLMAALFAEMQAFLVGEGKQTLFEAAQNIRDTLGISFQEALDLVQDIISGVRSLDGMSVDTTVRIHQEFDTVDEEHIPEGGAHGGRFTVPPRNDSDNFVVGATSGEEVVIQTPQQSSVDNSRSHTGDNNFFGVETAKVFEVLEDESFL